MDSKLRELQKRERGYAQLETLKARSEDACKRLQTDIQQIKQQKVALHRQLERANKEFQDWRKTREKEIMQLRAQVGGWGGGDLSHHRWETYKC